MAARLPSRPLPHARSSPNDGDSDLHVFAYKGEYDKALLCLLKGAKCDAENDWSQTPLHLATAGGHLDIMLLLLDAGACVNRRDHQDVTSLHQAVIHGNRKGAELLLCYGGSPHNCEVVQEGLSPLQLAEDLPLMHRLIESHTGKVNPLQHICRLAIRRIMGVTKRKRLRELPVPKSLVGYLETLPLSFADELMSDREKRRGRKSGKKPIGSSAMSQSHVLQILKDTAQ